MTNSILAHSRDEPDYHPNYRPDFFFNSPIETFWGIVAGPIGIRLSYFNNLSQTKCLWRAYIPLIAITMMGSVADCIHNSIFLASNDRLRSSDVAISYVEIIVTFGEPPCFYNVI